MDKPFPVNLMTPEEVRANGWQAEARDGDGHLISTHAPFGHGDCDCDILHFVRDALQRGDTVTIWPPKS